MTDVDARREESTDMNDCRLLSTYRCLTLSVYKVLLSTDPFLGRYLVLVSRYFIAIDILVDYTMPRSTICLASNQSTIYLDSRNVDV